jgi:hypothetical protein
MYPAHFSNGGPNKKKIREASFKYYWRTDAPCAITNGTPNIK